MMINGRPLTIEAVKCPKCGAPTDHVPGLGHICRKCQYCAGEGGEGNAENGNGSSEGTSILPFPGGPSDFLENPAAAQNSIISFAMPKGEDMRPGRYSLKITGGRWSKMRTPKYLILFRVIKGKHQGNELMYPVSIPKPGQEILAGSNLHALCRVAAAAQGLTLQDLPPFDLCRDDPGEWILRFCNDLLFTAEVARVTKNWLGKERSRQYSRVKSIIRAVKSNG